MLQDLQTKTEGLSGGGHKTTFTFKYKGKVVVFTFVLNGGDDLWASQENIRSSDLVVFHDSIYNDPPGLLGKTPDFIADRFIQRYIQLAGSQRRFILSENQWKDQCGSDSCSITGNKFSVYTVEGFYGCGSMQGGNPRYNPSFEVREGQSSRVDPKTPDFMRKHHVHVGSAYYSNPAVLLIYPPLP